MGYEAQMQADILGLLRLFAGRVPDAETLDWLMELTADREKWTIAHALFDRVRRRHLKAIDTGQRALDIQYCFEEVCLKSLYNETYPQAPFDSGSPYCVIKNAIALARAVGVPVEEVLAIVAPES
jgi:hypothetical protein